MKISRQLLVLVAAFFIFSVVSAEAGKRKLSGNHMLKFVEVLNLIDTKYYKPVEMDACIEKIFQKGVSNCTDVYSFYLNEKEKLRDKEFLEGNFGGVGMKLGVVKSTDSQNIAVAEVFPDTPAEKAGLLAGDIIVAVSSTGLVAKFVPVQDVPLSEVVNLIRGRVRTSVAVRVVRNQKQLDFLMVRDSIKHSPISHKNIKPGIGYIRIDEFSGIAAQDFFVALSSLTAGGGLAVLIIDVRNNPGGLMFTVLDILSAFSGGSVLLETREREDQTYFLPTSFLLNGPNSVGEYKHLKVVVLANQFSASASEILACWFKEDFGAPIIGVKTFGKGLVQNLFDLQDGGKLHLTIAEYFVGVKKVPVQGIGVLPTMEVKNPEEWTTSLEADDLQFKKALEVATELLKSK
ncbi:MAG: hypothetical protein A3H63_01795 [Candidatus Harrisonbacteria bacterium RIFCSPLOWO2_02_FULL_45_10c]|uniref:PDZ domain-containing protein n=1 Tax=Candidatus Harrisonbacteria bacterium RIFCSPLOWO2_02_FULL_45_10c TaxID=1798410 RepID=A0A1G1ZTK5_9BACT|nr:MAG: hypothetical protein A3H63_01795 [Candidatus Harrisonbacteria bacterium RIFCSPLOWO2_02_FULL_45_10c]